MASVATWHTSLIQHVTGLVDHWNDLRTLRRQYDALGGMAWLESAYPTTPVDPNNQTDVDAAAANAATVARIIAALVTIEALDTALNSDPGHATNLYQIYQ